MADSTWRRSRSVPCLATLWHSPLLQRMPYHRVPATESGAACAPCDRGYAHACMHACVHACIRACSPLGNWRLRPSADREVLHERDEGMIRGHE